jgi:hypothetical protein
MASGKYYSEWNVEEVCQWLKNECIPADIVECFRREVISGYCLSELHTEDRIIETCKGVDLKVGIKLKLKKLIYSLVSDVDNESSSFSRSPSVSVLHERYEVESVPETSSTRSNEPRLQGRSVVDAAIIAEVENNNSNDNENDECELKQSYADKVKQGSRLRLAQNAFANEAILEASNNGRLPTKAPSVASLQTNYASSFSSIPSSSTNATMSTLAIHPIIADRPIDGHDFVKLRTFEDDAAAAVSYCEGGIVESIYFGD